MKIKFKKSNACSSAFFRESEHRTLFSVSPIQIEALEPVSSENEFYNVLSTEEKVEIKKEILPVHIYHVPELVDVDALSTVSSGEISLDNSQPGGEFIIDQSFDVDNLYLKGSGHTTTIKGGDSADGADNPDVSSTNSSNVTISADTITINDSIRVDGYAKLTATGNINLGSGAYYLAGAKGDAGDREDDHLDLNSDGGDVTVSSRVDLSAADLNKLNLLKSLTVTAKNVSFLQNINIDGDLNINSSNGDVVFRSAVDLGDLGKLKISGASRIAFEEGLKVGGHIYLQGDHIELPTGSATISLSSNVQNAVVKIETSTNGRAIGLGTEPVALNGNFLSLSDDELKNISSDFSRIIVGALDTNIPVNTSEVGESKATRAGKTDNAGNDVYVGGRSGGSLFRTDTTILGRNVSINDEFSPGDLLNVSGVLNVRAYANINISNQVEVGFGSSEVGKSILELTSYNGEILQSVEVGADQVSDEKIIADTLVVHSDSKFSIDNFDGGNLVVWQQNTGDGKIRQINKEKDLNLIAFRKENLDSSSSEAGAIEITSRYQGLNLGDTSGGNIGDTLSSLESLDFSVQDFNDLNKTEKWFSSVLPGSVEVYNSTSGNIKLSSTGELLEGETQDFDVNINNAVNFKLGEFLIDSSGAITVAAAVSSKISTESSNGSSIFNAKKDIKFNANIESAGGDVVITSKGAVQQAQGNKINVRTSALDTGSVVIQASDNATFDEISANSTIRIESQNGNISARTDDEIDFQTDGSLLLIANEDIGKINEFIQIDVDRIGASSVAGGVYLHESNQLTVGATDVGHDYRSKLTTNSSGNASLGISLSAATNNNNAYVRVDKGSITVDETVTLSGSGNLSLYALGANDSSQSAQAQTSAVTVNKDLVLNGGDLTLYSGAWMSDLAINADLSTKSLGDVFVSSSGKVKMLAATSIDTLDGEIVVNAGLDASLANIASKNSSIGISAKNIFDVDVVGTASQITAGTHLSLVSQLGIGEKTNILEIDAKTLAATSNYTGSENKYGTGIWLKAATDIEVIDAEQIAVNAHMWQAGNTAPVVETGVVNAVAGVKAAQGGSVVLDITGALKLTQFVETLSDDINHSGNVLLKTTNSISISDDSNIKLTGGGLATFDVGGDFLLNGNAYVSTAGLTGSQYFSISGNLIMSDGSQITTEGANSALIVSGNSQVSHINVNAGTLHLKSLSITDSGDTKTDIVAASAQLISTSNQIGQGVGTRDNRVELSVGKITVLADSGDIAIINDRDLEVAKISEFSLSTINTENIAQNNIIEKSSDIFTQSGSVSLEVDGELALNDGLDGNYKSVSNDSNQAVFVKAHKGIDTKAQIFSNGGDVFLNALGDLKFSAEVSDETVQGGQTTIAQDNATGIVTSGTGTIYVDISGNINFQQNFEDQSGEHYRGLIKNLSGGVIIHATENFEIGRLISENNISIKSKKIIDGNDALDISAAGLYFDIEETIGEATDFVDIDVTKLASSSESAWLNEAGSVRVDRVLIEGHTFTWDLNSEDIERSSEDIRITSGNLSLKVADDLTVSSATNDADHPVVLGDKAGIVGASDGGIEISTSGKILLETDAAVYSYKNLDVTSLSSIELNLQSALAAQDTVNVTATGDITMHAATTEENMPTIQSYMKGVVIKSTEGGLKTGFIAAKETVELNIKNKIEDADAFIDIESNKIDIVLASAVGTINNPLQTRATELDAQIGSGGLYLVETDNLTLGQVSVADAGAVNIDVTSGNLNFIDADQNTSFVHSGSGQVTLRAQQDIALGYVQTLGNVALTATSGDVIDTDAALDIKADRLDIKAGTGVGSAQNTLDTDINTLNLKAGDKGGYVSEANALTIDQVSSTGSGTLAIDVALGKLDFTDEGKIHGETGAVTLSVADAIELGQIDTAAAVTLTSHNAGIVSGAHSSDISATHLTLNAKTHAGSADNQLQTRATELDAQIGNGGLYLVETDNLTLGQVSVADAGAVNIDVTSGNLNFIDADQNTSFVHSGSGQVTLRAQQDIALGYVQTLGNVALTATSGDVIDTDAALDIKADRLDIKAGTGVGSAQNTLDTDINTLNLKAGDKGGYVSEANALTIDQVSSTGSGTLAIDVALGKLDFTDEGKIHGETGAVTLSVADAIELGQIDTAAAVTLTSHNAGIVSGAHSSDISATHLTLDAKTHAGSADNQLQTSATQLDAQIGNGGLYLVETDNLTLGQVSVADAGAVNIDVTSGNLNFIDADQNTSFVHSGSGQVTLRAQQDIALGYVQTLGNVALTATSGDVIDTDAALDIKADRLDIKAGTGVGSAQNTLDTDINTLNLKAGDRGGYVSEANALTIDQVSSTGSGPLAIDVALGKLDFTDEGKIHGETGAVTLSVADAIELGQIDTAAAVTLTSHNAGIVSGAHSSDISATHLTLNAKTHAGSADNQLQTSATQLDAQIGSGGLYLVETDNLTLGQVSVADAGAVNIDVTSGNLNFIDADQNTSFVHSGSGQVTLRAQQDIALGYVQTLGNVALTATSGDVIDTDAALDIKATALTIEAAQNIGDSNQALDTDLSTLKAHSTQGNIFITDIGSVTLDNVGSDVGAVHLTAQKDIDQGDVFAHTQAIIKAGGHFTGTSVKSGAAQEIDVQGNIERVKLESQSTLTLTGQGTLSNSTLKSLGDSQVTITDGIQNTTVNSGSKQIINVKKDIVSSEFSSNLTLDLISSGNVTNSTLNSINDSQVSIAGVVQSTTANSDRLLTVTAGSVHDATLSSGQTQTLTVAGDVQGSTLHSDQDLTLVVQGQLERGQLTAKEDINVKSTGFVQTQLSSDKNLIIDVAQNVAGIKVNAVESINLKVGGAVSDGDTELDIQAKQLKLEVGGAFGTSVDPVEMQIETLEESSVGALYVHNSGDLNYGNLVSHGDITIETTGKLNAEPDSQLNAQGGVSLGANQIVTSSINAETVTLSSQVNVMPSAGEVVIEAKEVTLVGGPVGTLAQPLRLVTDKVNGEAGELSLNWESSISNPSNTVKVEEDWWSDWGAGSSEVVAVSVNSLQKIYVNTPLSANISNEVNSTTIDLSPEISALEFSQSIVQRASLQSHNSSSKSDVEVDSDDAWDLSLLDNNFFEQVVGSSISHSLSSVDLPIEYWA